VKVPVGTIIFRLPEQFHPHMSDSGFEDDRKRAPLDLRKLEPLADLNEPGAEFVLCQGGHGGKGNTHFKSSINRAPRRTTEGEPGEEGWFALELQTIADAGLVGYPNAGKSTLLGKISAAHPKVAPYPFTTLNPVVGVVELGGYRRATVADIPGLIEGAHENKGLGHEFLRHIERCKLLLFVIDMAGSEGRDPVDDFRTLRRELKLYDPRLAARPLAVVANKMDLPGAAGHLRQFKAKFRKTSFLQSSSLRRPDPDRNRNEEQTPKRNFQMAERNGLSARNQAKAEVLRLAADLCGRRRCFEQADRSLSHMRQNFVQSASALRSINILGLA
jgi:GTP-binding protein